MSTRLLFARPGLVALFALAPFAVALDARADEACGDGSCPRGFSCETYTTTACPAIDCAEDSQPCSICEPTTEEVCVPTACTSNADCAADMACITEEETRCEGDTEDCGDPRGGEKADCVPAPEANCTTERVSQCVPHWRLPCTSASDCGAGFTCEETESCACPGSPGSGGGSDPGTPTPGDAEERAATPAAPDDCSCEPSGVLACVAIETACTTDASCPTGWTCEENREGVCWSGPDGEGCEPADPAKLCEPPYSRLGGGRGVDLDDGESTGPGTGAPEVPVTAGSDDGDGEESDRSEVVTTDRGCGVARLPRSSGSAAAWLTVGILGLFVSRRRR